LNGGPSPPLREFGVEGATNVADSLAAIKKVVFDDKKVTMGKLIDALDKNFEGEENLLRLLLRGPSSQ